ncbi:MAG: DUF1492 domain-containing protein [Synergistaceae bacterium]|nr:DUF1492 domain-containing protein [Synergistaceae bacterium]
MKKRDNYRFAEKCLYEYPSNCSKLLSLEQELALVCGSSDARGHSYNVGENVCGVHSDPVASFIEHKMRLEYRINYVRRYTEPITRLVNDFNSSNVLENSKKNDCRKILKLFYFGRNSVDTVLGELNCCRTVFYERRKFLVTSAIQYLGL